MEKIKGVIGRENEIHVLEQMMEHEEAQLIAVYGRRRVGKTFLIKKFLNNKYDFFFTGSYETSASIQLTLFSQTLSEYSGSHIGKLKNWFEAFNALKEYLKTKTRKNCIKVFIDEIPWMDTPRSNFLAAFSQFWNSWASTCEGLKLIVCGSATTWMLDKFVGDKGGLYGRSKRSLYLAPFTLHETEEFLKMRNFCWTRYQMAEAYMIMGGIPYYIDMLDPSLPFGKNINTLFFAEGAPLRNEYSFLFRTLFREAQLYRNVVETLAKKAKGLTQVEIKEALKLKDGGELTTVLRNLHKCDFIRKYTAIGKKERDMMYQLTDLFTLFHLHFIGQSNSTDENFWTNMDDSMRRSWSGYAFEILCMHHIQQIKRRLGIEGVLTNACCWQTKPIIDSDGTAWSGAQIDLLLERADNIINLCEMKYAKDEFTVTESYYKKLNERAEILRHHTKTKAALPVTFITTHGLKRNMYSDGFIPYQVILDDLFA